MMMIMIVMMMMTGTDILLKYFLVEVMTKDNGEHYNDNNLVTDNIFGMIVTGQLPQNFRNATTLLFLMFQ